MHIAHVRVPPVTVVHTSDQSAADILQVTWPKTLLVVSHAREFLNAVTTDTIHLHSRKLTTYKGALCAPSWQGRDVSTEQTCCINADINGDTCHPVPCRPADELDTRSCWLQGTMRCSRRRRRSGCATCGAGSSRRRRTASTCRCAWNRGPCHSAFLHDPTGRHNRLQRALTTEQTVSSRAPWLQAFIDKFRFNAKRASMVQSRIKALNRLEDVG